MNVLGPAIRLIFLALSFVCIMGCIPIQDDEDTVRHAQLIASAEINVQDICFSDGDTRFRLQVFSAPDPGPALLVLHDNEQTAFDAAFTLIAGQGGRLIAVENDERRNIGRVDPNRIFGSEYALFTHIVTSFFDPDAPMVVLHTNRDGYGGPAGTISIKRWLNGNKIKAFDHGDDEDNLIWMAGSRSFGENAQAQAFVADMALRGVNVVYEHVTGPSDGSMSNWAALNGRSYFNIEVEDGQFQRQLDLVAALENYLAAKD